MQTIMELWGTVIALAVLAGLAILVIIPVLLALYCRKRRQAKLLQSQLSDHERSQIHNTKKTSQINSLPCRLKKKPSSGGGSRSAAGESGVYDMAEISQLSEISSKQQVTASYTGSNGDPQKLHLFGELSADDTLVVKEIISSYLEHSTHHLSAVIAEDTVTDVRPHRSSLALDDIMILGLDNPASLSYENEGYRRDDMETTPNNTSSKRRAQVKKTLSALSNRVRMNIRRDEKPISKLSDIGSMASCAPYTTFKASVIGQSGGDIVLPGGVKLSIPANALSEKVEIVLGVTFDPKHLPQLAADEALLTPVVFCQPSGLEFHQPATLTIPHCAAQVQENWKINILASQTDVESPDTEWKALQIGDYESRIFSKHEVQLCVNHFTMYCVAGTSKDKRNACKRKKLVSLATEQQPTILSVYCVNSYHQKNHHSGGADVCPPVLNIEANGQPIKLQIDDNIDNTQQIPYLEAWHDILRPATMPMLTTESLSCQLCGWQIGNTAQKYKLTLNPEWNKAQTSNGVGHTPRKRVVFSETLKWDIILLLDKEDPHGNDWKRLATELGVSAETIKAMEESSSPTKELLRIWEEHSHGCIRSFVAMVVRIHRLDVAEKVEEHVGKLYLETLPNHKCNDHC